MMYYKTVVYFKDGKIIPEIPDRILYFGRYYCEALKTLNEVRRKKMCIAILERLGYGGRMTHQYDVVGIEVVE